MGINNYTYLIESLWVLNVKCAWQKSLKQIHCTNTNDYCYCRWGNCGSGKLSDLLKVSWLVNVRTPKLVFPINHKGPRIFQLQHTIYLPHHTPLPEMSIHPMKLPLKYSCWSHTIKDTTPAVWKAHNASLKAWDGIPLSTMRPAQALLWAHSDKELQWRHRWTGSRCGVQRDGGSARAWSFESGTWRA